MSFGINTNEDGTFDLTGNRWFLKNCLPTVDGEKIRYKTHDVINKTNGVKIDYYTGSGKITVNFRIQKCRLTISSKLKGFEVLPEKFCPVYSEDVTDLNGLYRQGYRISGPSGNINSEKIIGGKPISSYGLVILKTEEENICFYSSSHDKYINEYIVSCSDKNFHFSAGFDTEKTSSSIAYMPEIVVIESRDTGSLLREASDRTAEEMNARKAKDNTLHWCSWYYLYHNLDQKTLDRYASKYSMLADDLNIKYMQIDAGYFTSAGDWLSWNHMWPESYKGAFDSIASKGFVPGIWVAPFMAGSESQVFKNHKDWILKDLNGDMIVKWKYYDWARPWGNKDEEYYILDTSHPGAMEYILNCFREFKKAGAKLFKTDFMNWGMQPSHKVKRFSPGKTSVEYFRDLVHGIREAVGDDSYILGCIAPFYPFIGYADAMRISGDTVPQWDCGNIYSLVREIAGDNYFNGKYWINDTDSFLARDKFTCLSAEEQKSLIMLKAVCGGVLSVSEDPDMITKEMKDFIRFVMPGKRPAPDIFFTDDGKSIPVICNRLNKGLSSVFLMNPYDEEVSEELDINSITGLKEGYIRYYRKKSKSVNEKKRKIKINIKPHMHELIFVSSSDISDKTVRNIWKLK